MPICPNLFVPSLKNHNLMLGTTYEGSWDDWYGPDGLKGPYNPSEVKGSFAGKAIQNTGMVFPSDSMVTKLRSEAQIKCPKSNKSGSPCNLLQQVRD